jgi:hypothetical protein
MCAIWEKVHDSHLSEPRREHFTAGRGYAVDVKDAEFNEAGHLSLALGLVSCLAP